MTTSPCSSPSPSPLPPSLQNLTAPPFISAPPLGMSCVTMATGALSNVLALAVLARGPFGRKRHRSKAPYLQLASALLFTDLGGHLVPGSLALHLHLSRREAAGNPGAVQSAPLCQLFGACMVYFGLSPLLLGGAMAVERYLGITRPLLHAATVTVGRARAAVATVCSLALLLALLPFADGAGRVKYSLQFPGTWCFFPVQPPTSSASKGLALAFCSLGLAVLLLSLLCNILSGLALLKSPLGSGERGWTGRSRPGKRSYASSSSSSWSLSTLSAGPTSRALEVEMMIQLVAITLVSCVCWTPFLIVILLSVVWFSSDSAHPGASSDRLVLLGLRMASWNQVLDPWIYILLRRSTIRHLCCLYKTRERKTRERKTRQRKTVSQGQTQRHTRSEISLTEHTCTVP
ncbi:prostaglandin E2 receptor EP1 subtype-like [Chanos chanos]|uniref:Thromboxane A2 receptor n=1 Tax=Chanos chanos TaxID=29144 RepID=A0A6J2VT09_CHACN|nr:prostaglandin E2 receptor EP1 subtype-like [Chanos chanos]